MFKVYTVHRNNTEMFNGPVTDVCSTLEFATTVASGKGFWGSNAPIEERCAVEIEGKIYLLASDTPVDLDGKVAEAREDLRKKALRKLSPEEQEVLGLN